MTLPANPAAVPATPAPPTPRPDDPAVHAAAPRAAPVPPKEIGGRNGPDPTRYGDWELKGRCIDF